MSSSAETPAETFRDQKDLSTKPNPWKIVWEKSIILILLHLMAMHGLYLMLTGKSTLKSFVLSYVVGVYSGLGVTAGAHRLWSHRAYKAKTPLRIFLMIANCVAFQTDVYKWSRDHRVHHKFTDTDADPYNSKRGFFFSHMGWLMIRRHPDVQTKGKTIDCSDILADPVIRFQIKYYAPLVVLVGFFLPTFLHVFILKESWWDSFLVAGVLRYILSLHVTCLVNSAAHMWGNRPYDQNITPRENILVSMLAHGEGFHNYHHAFPRDYSTSELGLKWNLTTAFIDLMAKIGQAYDLKKVSPEMVNKRKTRTGDLRMEHELR